MNDNDLTLIVARCLQNFLEVERHDPNVCYVPPDINELGDRAKLNYFNDAVFHRKVDTIVHVVNEHCAALREQLSQLQQENMLVRHQYDVMKAAAETLAQKADQLQREREELANEEPFGWAQQGKGMGWHPPTEEQLREGAIRLYRHPYNAAARIEAARKEERRNTLNELKQRLSDNDESVMWNIENMLKEIGEEGIENARPD